MLDLRTKTSLSADEQAKRMRRENIDLSSKRVDQVGPFWSTKPLNLRQRSRLVDLIPFFLDGNRLAKIVIPIISINARISLRLLHWFIINYAKQKKIVLSSSKYKMVNIYQDYRTWLRHWKGDVFDAFRRGTRIFFQQGKFTYSTTVAQLNFLYWCEHSGVLEYIHSHPAEVEKYMVLQCKQSKQKKGRRASKKSSLTTCMIYNVPVTMLFN